MAVVDDAGVIVVCSYKYKPGDKLYTSPPERKPLTDEQIYMHCPNWLSQKQCKAWVRSIEAAHGIKEKP